MNDNARRGVGRRRQREEVGPTTAGCGSDSGELSEVADRWLWKEKSSKILLIFISLIKKLNWLHSFNLCVKTEKDRSS